jgi:hypothetical protein
MYNILGVTLEESWALHNGQVAKRRSVSEKVFRKITLIKIARFLHSVGSQERNDARPIKKSFVKTTATV